MLSVARHLQETIGAARPSLLAITESRASEKSDPDTWSIKQILGHMIDSAANNHQRIVRMQEADDIGTFTYTQHHWVNAQQYQSEPWHDLVELWCAYNTHLAHIIAHVAPASLEHVCDMGYGKPAPLRFVIEDYNRHLEHHLRQILGSADPRAREKWVSREPR